MSRAADRRRWQSATPALVAHSGTTREHPPASAFVSNRSEYLRIRIHRVTYRHCSAFAPICEITSYRRRESFRDPRLTWLTSDWTCHPYALTAAFSNVEFMSTTRLQRRKTSTSWRQTPPGVRRDNVVAGRDTIATVSDQCRGHGLRFSHLAPQLQTERTTGASDVCGEQSFTGRLRHISAGRAARRQRGFPGVGVCGFFYALFVFRKSGTPNTRRWECTPMSWTSPRIPFTQTRV